ncbi:MAG: sulfite exporter TauE/SafE family protein [Lawsonibacter sp.]
MEAFIFFICLIASTIGGICGIGGGVIIKPVLDALNIMSVSSISFLSGLSVLSMSVVSMVKQRKSHLVEFQTGSLLAVGAVLGGMLGNALFHQLKTLTQESLVGMVQAIVLAVITILTLVYSAFLRSRLPSFHVQHFIPTTLLGMLMGVLSAFLGIGGGPINLAILYFAFSMDTKKAAANSLYIIMFSQASSFFTSCIQRTIPEFKLTYLIVMVAAGILGGILGTRINKRISAATTDKLFAGLLTVIVFVCFYNAWRFAP